MNTVLGLVNRLKIEQDKAHNLFTEGERLIGEAQEHLDNAHTTLVELAELQGIAIPHTNADSLKMPMRSPIDAPPYTPSYTPNDGSGPQRVMS